MMYLIRKTGEGKSEVLKGMATLMKGVTLSLVPLLGLGSDQSQKASETEFIGFEAHHIDEYRDEMAADLMKDLEKYSSEHMTSILLFVSPQTLQPTSKWYATFVMLAQRGHLSSICIDEVHAAVQNYVSFRPEFKTAVESVNTLVSIAKGIGKRVPILAMSATFTIPQQKAFNNLIHRTPSMIIWGDMNKRNIGFHTIVAGNPMLSLIKDWEKNVRKDPSKQSLIYSNQASSCDGLIMDNLKKARTRLPADVQELTKKWSFVALTGSCGVMLKSYLVGCFCRNQRDISDVEDDGDNNGDESTNARILRLPKIWCMPCTSAANCGVSSDLCNKCYRLGPPPNFHDMVQEMGRVDRLHDAVRGEHTYQIYLNVPTFISLWLRIQTEPVQNVRKKQEADLLEVLKCLVLPVRCYHDAIEEYFENPHTHVSRGGCGDYCSFCTKAYLDISGSISRLHLVSILTTHVFDKGPIRAEKLMSFFSAKAAQQYKKKIWRVAPTTVTPGQVHGLVLMLLAGKIIQARLTETGSNVKGKQLTIKNVEFILSKENAIDESDEEEEYEEVFSYNVDSNWKGFNLTSSTTEPLS